MIQNRPIDYLFHDDNNLPVSDDFLQESKVLDLEADFVQKHADLKLAFKRISDLQAALEEDMLSDEDLMLNRYAFIWRKGEKL